MLGLLTSQSCLNTVVTRSDCTRTLLILERVLQGTRDPKYLDLELL